MNNAFGRLPRLGSLLAALGAVLVTLAATSTAAMAMEIPPVGYDAPVPGTQPTRHPAAAVPAGMPGWELGLIVAGAVIVLAVLAVLAYRRWSARRRLTVTARRTQRPTRVSAAK